MEQRETRLAAVMYSDIAGFSRMMERDESGTLELLATQNTLVRSTVSAHGGRVIKSVGDAFLCEFPNTVNAVRCASEILEAAGIHNEAEPRLPMRLRIGVHLGDIHFLEDDAVGDGISVVTRLQAIAQPGRICISEDVYHLVVNRVDVQFERLGNVKLRDLSREIEAYEISVSEAAEMHAPGEEADEAPMDPTEPTLDRADHPSRADAKGRGPASILARNLQSGEFDDFNELKELVLREIKRAGRRISVDEIRDRIPRRGAQVDAALDTLADRGFLTRGRRRDGSATPGEGTIEISTPGGRTVYDDRGNRVGHEDRGPQRPPRPERDEWAQRFEEHWERHAQKHGAHTHRSQTRWDKALGEPGPQSGYDPLVEDYKDQAADVAEHEKTGLRAHLATFLSVNAGLFVLWALTTFGAFPWFMIPLLGWGIGIATHFATAREKIRESRELDRSEGLTREQLRIYRQLAKARNSWRGHLVSNLATSGFLIALNLIVSPGFMWSLIPVAFMGVGIFSHLPAYRARERRLTKRLRDLGARIGGIFGGKGNVERSATGARVVPADGPGNEAEQIRQRLLGSIAAMPSGSPLGEDFEPVLQNYVEQITLLDRKNRELAEIMKGIPLVDLERDLVALQRQRGEATSEKVIAEYDRSIAQIRKQQSSYSELRNEQEILRLRLSSSLNQLRQLEIDVVRMKSLSSEQEATSVELLKDKSQELSQYLDDLRAGYDELE